MDGGKGDGFVRLSRAVHAFLAIPTDQNSDAESAGFETRGSTGAVAPSDVAKFLFRLLRTQGWETGSERAP